MGVVDGLPDFVWVDVDGGPFIMGSDKTKDREAFGQEQPQFTCTLVQDAFRISRYPVTVAQYRAFVEAGGYAERRYWTKAGWAWRSKNDVDGPAPYDAVFQTLNHPQVGVSWYEAMAFCTWLREVTGVAVYLPTEAQWERAARHTDGRIYPWGDTGDPADHCNMDATGVGSTAAVGVFPQGDAVCGAADMSGNVWEWCSTKWRGNYTGYAGEADDAEEGDARRVVRGGSFYNYRRFVRCAYRDDRDPYYRLRSNGFRVVCPPGP